MSFSNLTFTEHNHYNDVESYWGKILPQNHHLNGNELNVLENSNISDINYKYLNFFRNNELIGVAYFQIFNFKKDYIKLNFKYKIIKYFVELYLSIKKIQILVCGNLFRVNFQGFYFKDKNDKQLIFHFIKEFKKKNNFYGILVKDCSREFDKSFIQNCFFKSFKSDRTMELFLNPNWNTFEDYLTDLTRKYRQRAVKIRNNLQRLNKYELDLENLTKNKKSIEKLYFAVAQKQNFTLGYLTFDYFYKMKELLNENFVITGYFENDNLVGFSSHIYYPNSEKMEIHYIGFDYQKNIDYNIYFNILFEGLEKAILKKFKSIELGRTAREAKSSLGAVLVENFNYVWMKNIFTKMLLNFVDKKISKENNLTNIYRSPFK